MTLEKLMSETAGRKDRGIVTLIGPPQWGKTEFATRWSKNEGRTMVRLLAQTMEPEAICGYDVKHPKTGELHWMPPSWLRVILKEPEKKWTLFIDELDKAREATLTALLTLLCDRMVQNQSLPDTVAIVAAMNVPRAPLPPALVERLLFVPFPTGNDLENTILPAMDSLKSIAQEYLEVPKVAFPDRVKNAGAVFRLLSWSKCHDFWKDEMLRHTVITGLVPLKDVAWWVARLDPKAFVGVDLATWAENARPSDLMDSIVPLFNADKDQQHRYDALKKLCDRANADPSGEIAQVLAKIAEKMHEIE